MSRLRQATRAAQFALRSLCLTPLASVVLLGGCERASAAASEKQATQYIVGIDISGSRTPSQLQEEQLVVDALIVRMTYGDRLVLIETYRTDIDSAGQWQDSIPFPRIAGRITGRDKRNLQKFNAIAQQMNASFFDPERSKQVTSTDLFHTLSRASDYARAANQRKTIVVLLSDMLQSTREMNMEKPSGIPSDRWTDDLKQQGRLPELNGVCVFVVGADPTTRHGAQVRAFWQHYFQAAGANFPPGNYRNMVADAAQIGCG